MMVRGETLLMSLTTGMLKEVKCLKKTIRQSIYVGVMSNVYLNICSLLYERNMAKIYS